MLLNQFQFSPVNSNILNGQITFNDVPSFMQGIYSGYGAATNATGTVAPGRFWSYKTLGFYAQDDLKATSRLTLNLGLRYEFQTVPRERFHRESRFLNFYDPTQTWTYGPIMRNPSLKNFSPIRLRSVSRSGEFRKCHRDPHNRHGALRAAATRHQ